MIRNKKQFSERIVFFYKNFLVFPENFFYLIIFKKINKFLDKRKIALSLKINNEYISFKRLFGFFFLNERNFMNNFSIYHYGDISNS